MFLTSVTGEFFTIHINSMSWDKEMWKGTVDSYNKRTWLLTWPINWTGLTTKIPSTGKNWAGCICNGHLQILECMRIFWSPSMNLLWCAGASVSLGQKKQNRLIKKTSQMPTSTVEMEAELSLQSIHSLLFMLIRVSGGQSLPQLQYNRAVSRVHHGQITSLSQS